MVCDAIVLSCGGLARKPIVAQRFREGVPRDNHGMDWTYVSGVALYVALVPFCLWVITRQKDFWDWVHYYKADSARGGYVDLDHQWVPRKIFWREWGWYGVVVITLLVSPLFMLYVFLWEGLIGRFLKMAAPAGMLRFMMRLFKRKEVPVSMSGGDGSSREAAIVIGADNTQDGIRAEFQYVQQKHGLYKVAWKRDMQMKVRAEGRDYDVVSIVLTDGMKKTFWFDITSFSGKWR